MKSIKSLLILVPFLLLAFTIHSFAEDTDLYVGGGPTVRPNILIIFDRSQSMSDKPVKTYCEYDPSITYLRPTSGTIPAGVNFDKDKVYKKVSNSWWPSNTPQVYKDQVSLVPCANAKNNYLATYGRGKFTGKPENDSTKSPYTCNKGDSTDYATGNWIYFNYADPEKKETCKTKMEIAQKAITDLLGDTDFTGVRVGLMTFNTSHEGGNILTDGIVIKDLDQGNDRSALINKVNALSSVSTGTPLAESLYEAGLYFQGAASKFNSGTYTTPIQQYCQKNYVIFMTDGLTNDDCNPILDTAVGDRDGDNREPSACIGKTPGANAPDYGPTGTDYLDDVARYLYDRDLLPDNPADLKTTGKQNVITYTIGFELDMDDGADKARDLLERTARLGHGKFYTTEGSAGLSEAFTNIVNEVLAKTSSFVAPIVPVSKMERTTAGDKIYLAFFRPSQSGIWSGNIKRYGVAQSNDPSKGIVVGDILDISGSKALDSNGEFYPSSKSHWTTSGNDGGEVQVGGVGEILQSRKAAYPTGSPVQDSVTYRNIYTLLPGSDSDLDKATGDSDTSFDLTDSRGWNFFTTTNARLTASALGVSTGDKDNLVNFIRGIDVYDDNLNGHFDDKRDWMLGSFLHSRPYVIYYKDRTVIYAGANDGMLHAFDDDTGEELWGFIPPNLLDKLKCLHNPESYSSCSTYPDGTSVETPVAFVDGSPKAYVTYASDGITVTQAILIFGLRRGGNYYYALDVTNPTVPKYLWRIYRNRQDIGGGSNYYQELAQTWSAPVIGKVAYQTGEKWVAIFGAGYDIGQDELNPPSDNYGRGIYMADVNTGNCIWYKSYRGGQTDMTYSIPSDVAKVDLDGDGKIDRLYVGDMNSQMWRFDIGDLNKNGSSDPDEWTYKKIFTDTTEKRKVFYPPDVTFEKDSTGEYEMLFFGTGDREDPKKYRGLKNRIYALKDKNPSTPYTKNEVVNVTDFYTLSADQKTAKINEINSGYGWYIELGSKPKDLTYGEKCLASPVVYNKTAYFTTFTPSTVSTGDDCFVGEGTATLYALDYSTGQAVLNLDGSLDGAIGVTDRSVTIGTAIPSGVVITVIGGKVAAYAGVGGGVERVQLTSTRSLFPLTWKLVF